jgi:hypothetical protein
MMVAQCARMAWPGASFKRGRNLEARRQFQPLGDKLELEACGLFGLRDCLFGDWRFRGDRLEAGAYAMAWTVKPAEKARLGA